MSENKLLEELNSKPLFFKYLPYENTDGVTSAHIAASRITGRAKGGGFGVKVAFSVRLEPASLHFVDIAAMRASVSRNEMVNLVIEAGIEAILDSMDKKNKDSILEEYSSTPFRGKLVSSGD